jgi:DNA-binding Lrp family transcriptional regulator
VPGPGAIDATDARLLLALADDPRATVLALAERTGLSRNTVQARLDRLVDHRVRPLLERLIRAAAGRH